MSERAFDFLHQPSLGRGWLENRAAILSLRLALALVTTAALVAPAADSANPTRVNDSVDGVWVRRHRASAAPSPNPSVTYDVAW